MRSGTELENKYGIMVDASSAIRVASLQIEVPDAESKAEQVRRVRGEIAALPEVDVVLLPEIWNVGYFGFDTYRDQAEPLGGETAAAMADAARRKGAYLLGGSIVERDGDDLFNTSLLFDRRGNLLLATYRKIHLFAYGSAETRLLTAGRDVVTVPTELGTIGLSTCYDPRFPELYRAQLGRGAELFLVVSAWPFPRLHHWVPLNQARVIENQACLISRNCAGLNQGRHYVGHSMVTDPWGAAVAGAEERPGTVLGPSTSRWCAGAGRSSRRSRIACCSACEEGEEIAWRPCTSR